jgi:hypothetical protein
VTRSDDTWLEILALYDQGWEPPEIAEILCLPVNAVHDTLEADALEYPEEPLRSHRVLH